MTLKSLRAELRRTRKAIKHHTILARRNRRKAARIRRQITEATNRAKALRFALSKVGAHEDPPGSNRGPGFINDCQVASGFKPGVSWCQCFVNVVARAGGAKLIKDGYTPHWLSGNFGKDGYRAISVASATPGDFVYFKFPGVSRDICDHVGVLVSRTPTTVTCVEGNTSPAGGSQNNGGGVYLKTRSRSLVAGAVTVPYPVEA